MLDEPTVGLDERNEREVQDSLRKLAKGRTTLLVTHDLRQAAQADEILFLKEGAIVERGTHQQLIQADRHYASLYRSQLAATTADGERIAYDTAH